jgi:hypothetical protein
MKPPFLLAACAALALSSQASAQTIEYRISGAGHVAIFRLDANPTPEFLDPGYSFGVTTTGRFDGAANLAGITFYLDPFEEPSDVASGGLTYLDNGSFFTFDVAGPQLFSGPINAPTLLAFGSEQISDLNSGETITISARAVPETASWALMVAGFGLAGGALRRRAAPVAIA